MDANQRKVIAAALVLIAIVLFIVYFGHPFWQWATWRETENTVDLGFLKINVRPPFPSDGRGIGLGLIVPIALAAMGRVFTLGRKS